MVDTYSWDKKNTYICKSHIENRNLNILSRDYLEKAKTSLFSLQLLFMIGKYTSQYVLVSNNSVA